MALYGLPQIDAISFSNPTPNLSSISGKDTLKSVQSSDLGSIFHVEMIFLAWLANTNKFQESWMTEHFLGFLWDLSETDEDSDVELKKKQRRYMKKTSGVIYRRCPGPIPCLSRIRYCILV